MLKFNQLKNETSYPETAPSALKTHIFVEKNRTENMSFVALAETETHHYFPVKLKKKFQNMNTMVVIKSTQYASRLSDSKIKLVAARDFCYECE